MNTRLRLLVLLALLLSGLERSEAQWAPTKGPYSAYVTAIAEAGPNLLAGTGGGIYRSTDRGTHWTLCNTGPIAPEILCIAVSGSLVLASTPKGILWSDDQGMTWTWANGNLPQSYWYYTFFAGNYLYAGDLGGLYRSDDSGRHWTVRFQGGASQLTSMAVVDTTLFIGTSSYVVRTDLGCTSWSQLVTGPRNVRSLAVIGKTLYAFNWEGVQASTDLGVTWKSLGLSGEGDFRLYAFQNQLFAVSSRIFYTSDNGTTWNELHTGLDAPEFNAMAVSGSTLFTGMDDGIHRSSDNGSNWEITNEGLLNVSAHAVAGADNSLLVAAGQTVYRSTDHGDTWARRGTTTSFNLFELTRADSVLYAASYMGVSRSLDNGATWTIVNLPGGSQYMYSVWASGSTICAGKNQEGYYRSTDDGTSWSAVDVFPLHAGVNKFVAAGNDLFALNSKMYRSSDKGATWTAVSNGMIYQPTSLAASGSVLYAGTYGGGVYRSADRGANWNQVSAGLPYHSSISAIAVAGSKIIACVPDSGIYLSANDGYSWSYAGTAYSDVNSFVVQGDYIYAGTKSTSLWKRQLSELVTSAHAVETTLPRTFSLGQNFPNPFNPSTTISFSLPSSSFVTLKIFDVMGREAATVVSEEMPAGNYSRHWNASIFPSGMYFYRLHAGAYSETKRLILVK
jgi:photosystem II stability/assembly factor-like uncharacterized protein